MDTHLQIQEKIFKILEPFVISCIENLNQQFKSHPSIKNSKIVIVGGYAMNQYIANPIATTDIDARIIFTDTDNINNIVKNDNKTMKMLYTFKNIAMNSFVATLNNIVEKNPDIITQIIKETGIELVKVQLQDKNEKYFFQQLMKVEKIKDVSSCVPENFNYVETILTETIDLGLFNDENYCSYKLSSCMFVYEMFGGKQIATSIFDLVPGCNFDKPAYNYSYNYTTLNSDDITLINKWYQFTDFPQFVNTKETYGYIPHLLSLENSNEIKPNLFIAGLGYVVWDTVYMINLCLDYLSKTDYTSQDFKENLVSLKFNRYIAKYLSILKALDTPKSQMTCKPFSKFISTCKDKI